MKISVFDVIQDETAAFEEEGAMVYDRIAPHISEGEYVELSFDRIEICSTRFLNACVGRFYLEYPQNHVDSLLSFSGISESNGSIHTLLEKVKYNAIHSELYQKIVCEAIG